MHRPASFWIATAAALGVAALLFSLGWQRYESFHNETFDLALYGRMAWGMARGSLWDPVTNAHALGVHIMPILLPLGLLGELFGLARTLLAVQSLSLALTALPLFVIAQRRLGTVGACVIAMAWWTYPHLFHVASYEFHPGNLGVFFLALACAIDVSAGPKVPKCWWWALLAAVMCREDIALSAAILVFMNGRVRLRKRIAALCVAYFAVFAFVLVPIFGPKQNSVVLHFGHWGQSLPEVALYLLSHPLELFRFLFSETRIYYLLRLLGCLAFLPLLGARWLLPALPFLAMNLISAWPTATELDSHYQTLLLPFVFVAAIDGLAKLQARSALLFIAGLVLMAIATSIGHLMWGGSWLADDFEREDFRVDTRTARAGAIVDLVPEEASVQAPYALMPHLMERAWIAASPPPDRDFDTVIVDLSVREGYQGKDTILRTDEEPFLRAWLGRDDYGLVAFESPYALLRRGAEARAWARSQGVLIASGANFEEARAITACLHVRSARLDGDDVVIEFVAAGGCDKDLAIRFGDVYRAERVELPFAGLLNPAQLYSGDVVVSRHVLSAEERLGVLDTGLCVGAVRQSGVRPDKKDPVSVCLEL